MARRRSRTHARGPALLRLVRPGNALLAAVGVLVGSILDAPPDAAGIALFAPSRAALLGALAALAFAAAGNVRNDLSDVEVDRAAHPDRPLVRGEVTRGGARFLVVVLYAVALESAALVSLPALALVLVALPLLEAYERVLKQKGLVGNVAIAALTAAPLLMGALARAASAPDARWAALDPAALTPAVLAVALLAALANAGREVLKDVEDAAADAPHRRTLPHRIGARRAALVAAALLGAAVLLSPLPWALESVLGWPYLLAVAAADVSFLAAAAVGSRRPGLGQRLAKVGMVLALAALVAGRAVGR